MNRLANKGANYGNWISKWLIYAPACCALVCAGLCWISLFFSLPAVFFLAVTAYFIYAYFKFSPSGGDIQTKIRDLVLDKLGWDGNGRVIDIGCGNAAIVTKLARKYPKAAITGIDYWGGKWGYSKEACEKNAEIEGVSAQTTFLKASASKLPFTDGYFDAAISNFVFHEVKDTSDKKEVLREALRVVRKGGAFAFQDLFLEKQLYGSVEELLESIRGWGIQEVKFIDTSDADYVPRLLKLNFMLGATGILYGKK